MLMINRVIEGPMHIGDMPFDDWPPNQVVDAGQHWLMEVEVQTPEEKTNMVMSIKEFDLAYDIDKHFRSGGSPIEVREDFSLWSGDELIWDGDEG